MSGRYFSSYDGKTVMADVDVNGNSLELTIEDEKVKAIGNIPVGGGDDSVWTSETSNALADDEGDDILDEEGNVIGDENAETLWVTRNGIEFKAKRAEADINGNSLELHVNDEGKIDKIGDKYIEGTGDAPVDAYSKEETDALLANKQDALSGLPTVAANKYLQTDENQNIVWGNLPAEKDEVAIYSYGSNASGIYSDYQQGKAVFCKYNSSKLIPLTGVGSNWYSFDGVINDDDGVSYSGPRFIHIELAGISSWSMKVFKIPEPSSNYANRVLTVDSDGAPQWVAPATMTGASAQSAGSSGLVPAPAAGDEEKFLKGDGTWATPPEVTPTPRQIGALAARDTYVDGGTIYSLVISAPDKPASIFTYTDEGSRQLNYWGVPYNGTTTGQVLTYNKSSGPYWAMPADPLPTLSVDNSLLLGQSDGSKTWAALENDVFGTQLLDENDQPILDETTQEPIYDAYSTDQLWTGFAGKGFGAIRAYEDQDGNNIKATYATKSSVDTLTADLETALDTLNDTIETVSHAGMYDLGTKTEADLNNGKLAIGCGNSNTELTLTTVSALTVLANSGVPNFALLVDNSGNSNDVTVTVKDSTDATTFYQSTAAGNKVSAGKICQITCVGKCWTLAEFEAPA